MHIKAKPTMFDGTLYRSKSEAKLAVCMKSWGWRFEYEPNTGTAYTPDFMVCNHPRLLKFIEYKPEMPNKHYCMELAQNFRELRSLHEKNDMRVVCELWVINFYSNPRKMAACRFFVIDGELLAVYCCDWLIQQDFSAADSHRFDL